MDSARLLAREALLTEQEVAWIVRKTPRTLQRWRILGGGPPFIPLPGRGGAVYPSAGLREWIQLNTTEKLS